MEVIYVYTVLGVCLRFRNDILLRAVTYVHNVPRGDILRWVSREAREKKIEKVNGWRKENDTWRRGGEAIPLSVSSFPSSCLSYLCSSSNLFLSLSHSPSYFFVRHSSPVHRVLTIRHERRRGRGRETCPARRGPHGIVTIVIYISFLFISMTTSLKHRQSEEARNSQRPRGSNSLRLVL